jgi:hypothetical protein
MISWFRYVPVRSLGQYLAAGWTIADDMAGTHLGYWSVLMTWTGAGEPPCE